MLQNIDCLNLTICRNIVFLLHISTLLPYFITASLIVQIIEDKRGKRDKIVFSLKKMHGRMLLEFQK